MESGAREEQIEEVGANGLLVYRRDACATEIRTNRLRGVRLTPSAVGSCLGFLRPTFALFLRDVPVRKFISLPASQPNRKD